jgi:cell shape-determining protein MreC
MNLSRRNNTERWRLLAATVLVVVVFLFDIFTGGSVRSLVRSAAGSMWQGAGAVVHALDAGGWLASRSALAGENQYLRAELAKVQDRSAGYSALLEENARLQSMLDMTKEHPKGIVAVVSSPVALSPNHTHLIAAGSSEGVKVGDVAITDAGFIVGRIIEVQAHTALMKEVFASGETLTAVINKNTITITGKSGVGYGRLAHEMEAQVNDPVFAAAFGHRPIGIVGSVESTSTNAYRDMYVDLPVNPQALQFVYVVDSAEK